MPMKNGTGPQGAGPGTGRGLGPCGKGSSFKRGFRRFCRFGLQSSPKNEKQILEEEATLLEDDLKSIKERIQELKEE
jgi:hypothetical protein